MRMCVTLRLLWFYARELLIVSISLHFFFQNGAIRCRHIENPGIMAAYVCPLCAAVPSQVCSYLSSFAFLPQ